MFGSNPKERGGAEVGKLAVVLAITAAVFAAQIAVLTGAVARPLAATTAAVRAPSVDAARPEFQEEIVVGPPPGWTRPKPILARRAALPATAVLEPPERGACPAQP